MATLSIHGLLRKRALVTRESASAIREAVEEASADDEVTLDFAGVDAVTPSFVDEILGIVEDAAALRGKGGFRLIFLHPPTRLSSKFAAVGRARNLEVGEAPDGAWIIAPKSAPVQ